MRIGLVYERKRDRDSNAGAPADWNSELLSEDEEDELLSGLRDAGHEVARIADTHELLLTLPEWVGAFDLVFNRSVGYVGLERKLVAPAALEGLGIPYVGSTPYVQMLTRHKYHTKLVVAAAGVPTPPAWIVPPATEADLRRGPFPMIVKPVAESSSIGITQASLVATPEEALRQARQVVERYRQPAIVEAFIEGAELEIPLLVSRDEVDARGPVAITLNGVAMTGRQFLSSDSVYDDGYGFAEPPAEVNAANVLRFAELAALALGIRDYGRCDFRVDRAGNPWFIEASTQPHLQRHSSFMEVARHQGRDYPGMLDEILAVARERVGRNIR